MPTDTRQSGATGSPMTTTPGASLVNSEDTEGIAALAAFFDELINDGEGAPPTENNIGEALRTYP